MPSAQELRDTFEQQYQLGMPQVDKIHGEFIDLLIETLESAGSDFLGNFRRLQEHTQLHFFEEEARMTAHEFDGLAEHAADHAYVLSEMENLGNDFEQGVDEEGVKTWLRDFLPNWFDQHTRNMDGAVARWVREHSIK